MLQDQEAPYHSLVSFCVPENGDGVQKQTCSTTLTIVFFSSVSAARKQIVLHKSKTTPMAPPYRYTLGVQCASSRPPQTSRSAHHRHVVQSSVHDNNSACVRTWAPVASRCSDKPRRPVVKAPVTISNTPTKCIYAAASTCGSVHGVSPLRGHTPAYLRTRRVRRQWGRPPHDGYVLLKPRHEYCVCVHCFHVPKYNECSPHNPRCHSGLRPCEHRSSATQKVYFQATGSCCSVDVASVVLNTQAPALE